MTPLIERFIKYVKFETTSDENTGVTPSTPTQMVFAKELKKDLEEMGLSEVSLDDNGYLYATLPANTDKDIPTIGFIAHMDTAPDMSGKDVKLENGKYVPDSAVDAREWYIDGYYNNELLFNVFEDGASVTIGLSKTEGLPSDYCPIGAWTLTRMGDADETAATPDKEEVEPTPEPVDFADGKYYLFNTASDLFWGAGNDWGTRASLIKHPEYVTLIKNEDGTYKMESQVSNGGTAYYFNGDYMDNGNPVALTITQVEEPYGYLDDEETQPIYVYTIANGTNYYGYDGTSTVLGKNLAADSENAQWLIFSEEQVWASLAEATQDEPVDATFMILDANFGRNNRNMTGSANNWTGVWKMENATNYNINGNNVNNCMESFHSQFNLSQKIANAPAGLYKLEAQGFYRQDGSDEENLPVFYLNDQTSAFPLKTGAENSMSDASVSFTAGKYQAEPIYLKLEADGELTVGAKLENNTNLWCIWDNFVLTYYGPDADINEVKFGALDDYQKELIERYINTDEPYDKAGAYGIQQGGALLVETVEGDYFSVVGLPVRKLSQVLENLNAGN